MVISCKFIDLIIPISKIDLVYEGGFSKFKKDNVKEFADCLCCLQALQTRLSFYYIISINKYRYNDQNYTNS